MSIQLLVGAAGAIVGGLVTLACFIWQLPRIRAEARKLNAEASRTEWQTLRDELERLDGKVRAQGAQISGLEATAEQRMKREAVLKRENGQLRAQVKKLEGRVTGLEAVFKIGPVTAEMQAALDRLNRIA